MPKVFPRLASAAATGALAFGLLAVATGPSVIPTVAAAPRYHAPPFGTLWVSTYDGAPLLVEFAPGANGDATPIAKIVGANTGLNGPAGIGVDSLGRVWVANDNTSTITAYGPQDKGNALPALSISGPKTMLVEPTGLAVSRTGDVWVANTETNTVLEFAPGSVGNVAPTKVIAGARTGLQEPQGIALSPNGKHLWVADTQRSPSSPPDSLTEYSTSAHGNVAPERTITGPKTKLDHPEGVAVSTTGLVVANYLDPAGDTRVLFFGPTAHGNTPPRRSIVSVPTSAYEPYFIALDAVGDVWVNLYQGNGGLIRFGSSQHGTVTPDRNITGAATSLTGPIGVAVFMAPPTSPRSPTTRRTPKSLTIRWKVPHSAGGGIIGYLIRRAHSKSGPWKVVATRTAKSFTTHKSSRSFFYDVEAFNDAGYSSPTRAISGH